MTGSTSTTTTTSITRGDSASPLAIGVSWGSEMTASVVVKTGPFNATITNSTKETATAAVSLLAMGLDQRTSQVTLGTYTMTPGATQTVPIQLSDIPMQSVGSPAQVELIVTTSGTSWSNIRLPQASIYLQYTPDYTTAYASISSTWAPVALSLVGGNLNAPNLSAVTTAPATYYSGLINNTSAAMPTIGGASVATQLSLGTTNTVAARSAAIGQALYNQVQAPRVRPVGRYKDATGSWASASTTSNIGGGMLPIEPAETQLATLFVAGSTSTASSASPSIFPVPPIVSNVKMCFNWGVNYLDSGFGETGLTGSGYQTHGARYANAIIWPASGGYSAWSGSLDGDGCTPVVTLWTGNYILEVDAQFNAKSHPIVFATDDPNFVGEIWQTPFTVSLGYTGGTAVTSDNRFSRAAAVMSEVLKNDDPGLTPNVTTTITVSDGHCNNEGAYANGQNVCLGYDADNNDNTLWKYVVAHEFGHTVDYSGAGMEQACYLGDNCTAEANTASCRCDFVSGENGLHCLQSWEQNGASILEGWAQFFASTVFNSNESSCTFVYYKQIVNDDGIIKQPPIPTSCTTPKKWMQTHCDIQKATNGQYIGGVEWDWMIFLWNTHTNTNYGSNLLSMSDLFNVKRMACSGSTTGSCTSTNVLNYPMLDTAAQTVLGVKSAKYQQFSKRAGEAGIVN